MIYEFRGNFNWLSNFYPCKVIYKDNEFNSVEQAYMFAKNDTSGDWLNFCLNNSPAMCKAQSKLIKIRDDWDSVKLKIMEDLLFQKFNQEPFKTKLIETGNRNIVEGNFWGDIFWGVNLKVNPNYGENHLGRIIMKIREKINE